MGSKKAAPPERDRQNPPLSRICEMIQVVDVR